MVDNLSKTYFIKSSYAEDWTEKVRSEKRLSELELKLINLTDPKNNELILEIGAGEGRIAEELLKTRILYIGVDISHQILTFARDELKKRYNSNFHLITADSSYLPIRPLINKILAVNTLFFCPDRYKTLNDSRNILKINGKIILDNINTFNLYYIIYYIYGKLIYFIKKIAIRFNFIRKVIKLIRKRDLNPYLRPGSKGNVVIYLYELKKLSFNKISYDTELTPIQSYFLKIIPNPRIRTLIIQKVLKYFSGRLILQAQKYKSS